MATTVKQPKSTDAAETHADGRRPRRTLSATFGRHPVLFLGLFCLLCSAALAAGTLVPRRYELSGTMHVAAPAIAELPELNQVAEKALKELQAKSVQVALAGDAAASGGQTVRFSASGDNRNTQWVAVEMAGEQFSQAVRDHAQDLVATYRSGLRKSAEKLAAAETALSGELEAFRAAHRGLLPDDPSSVLAQFDKLNGKLEDRQERLQVVTGQIARLQQLQKGGDVAPSPGAAPVTQAAKLPVDRDAEVVAVQAQLQLINDQIDEQLGTLRRTEQHPYVINLREKQAALQKKLEAAKARAAAGEPPPPDAQVAISHGNGANTDQAVNMQIMNLEGERDALEAEVKTLANQSAAMQKQVDEVTPIRRQYEKLTVQLAATRQESESVQKKTAELSRQAKTGDTGAEPIIAVSGMEMATESTLPAFPLVPQVYGGALLLAGFVTWVTLWVMHLADRSWHSTGEAAVALDVHVLGAVSEIRTRGQRTKRALWRWLARPALVTVWILVLAGSAWWSYQRLADPTFPQRVQEQGVTAFFAGHSGD